MTVRTYEQFLSALNEMGFLLFGGQAGGLLKLGEITAPGSWHCDEAGCDPWDWKTMLAEGRDGVYARLLGGQTFLISWEWYPLFLAAYRTCDTLEARYEAGEVNAAAWKMHGMFEERPALARHELTPHFSKAEVEKGLRVLQREMYITVSGEVQKLTASMQPVGWPSMEYTRVDVWTPESLEQAHFLDASEARERLLKQAMKISPGADEAALRRLFEVGPV